MRGQLCSYTVWPASQCRRRKSANKGFRGEAERVSPITPLLQIRGKLILAQAIENLVFRSRGDERVSKTAPTRLLSSSLARDVRAKRGARLPSSANRPDG
jgi:hypothetical protein